MEISVKFIARKKSVMKHLKNLLALFFIFSSSFLNGQTDIKIKKSEFKKDKNGFDMAWQHVTVGDSYYSEKGVWYREAFDEYVKAGIYNSSNPELNYKTGVSALFSDNKEKASEFFLKAIQYKSGITNDILLLTGHSLQFAGKYAEAIEKLTSYLNSPEKKSEQNISEAKRYIDECNSAIITTKDTLRIEIKNLGSNINSDADEYSEIFSSDGKIMYFASRREFSKSSTLYGDGKYDENIFFSTLINGTWETAASAGKNLNTKFCETPLYINAAGDELFIYAGYENGGDIKVSMQKKNEWKTPSSIPYNINSNGAETSFTFNPAGNEIWFVTDKGKDGLGGKDIYIIKKLDEKKWSKPVNAGANINSPMDEESVRFSDLGDTIWFGSRGHNSIGGFDVFYSLKDTTGEWGKAVNYGFPVNTSWDDIFYNKPKGSKSFYLASNRPGTIGGLDIFEGKALPPKPVPVPVAPPKRDTVVIRDTVVVIKQVVQAPPQPVVAPAPVPEPPKEVVLYLIGKVKDSETSDPVLAKIDLIDLATDQNVATTASSDVDGTYRIRIPEKKPYMVDFRGAGFLSDMKRINIPSNYSSDVYNLDVSLVKIKVGKKVVLNNILFETGKSILTTSSYAELDRLYNILTDNTQMKIEISGHTDKTGSEPINFKLSQDRAKSVVEYLVRKGIDRSRLEYKGFGSLQPIADNTTAAGRTKNRRVEFKILEF
jgi:outer membrane protein OmpA-like peptidoglycan-associated protein